MTIEGRSPETNCHLSFFICHLPLVICQILLCDEAFGLRLGCSVFIGGFIRTFFETIYRKGSHVCQQLVFVGDDTSGGTSWPSSLREPLEAGASAWPRATPGLPILRLRVWISRMNITVSKFRILIAGWSRQTP